jgi:ribosomal protein S14
MPKKSSKVQNVKPSLEPPDLKMSNHKKIKPPRSKWDLYRDGISQSLLGKFVVCRERFRIYAVEGLRPAGRKEAMEFGTIFHKALEYATDGLTSSQINTALLKWAKISKVDEMLCRIAAVIVPHYKKAWQDEDRGMKKHSSEEVFMLDHKCSSANKIIPLRGRFDSIFIRNGKLWLQENKTKSRIDDDKISMSLPYDLQTMLYCYAMTLKYEMPIGGVLYNVIRKPELKQGVKETDFEFLTRINEDIATRPEHYFKRYSLELSIVDVRRFVDTILDPLLGQVCLWWESIKENPFNPWISRGEPNPYHYVRPFGIFDPMSLGRGDYFEWVTTGSKRELEEIESPFPELVGDQGDSLIK